MSGMFWIALELSIPKIGFNIMISLSVKKLDAFKFDGVAESDNTVYSRSKPGLLGKRLKYVEPNIRNKMLRLHSKN